MKQQKKCLPEYRKQFDSKNSTPRTRTKPIHLHAIEDVPETHYNEVDFPLPMQMKKLSILYERFTSTTQCKPPRKQETKSRIENLPCCSALGESNYGVVRESTLISGGDRVFRFSQTLLIYSMDSSTIRPHRIMEGFGVSH
ncbi:hypothetical protein NC652_031814 [Populus alba x Populus x berolinensis]|nr:hypothetical protein NC652_031814 [Populus alba x Populus x berolinensis]